jgi:hypothetical protein
MKADVAVGEKPNLRWRMMSDWNLLDSLEWLHSGCYVMHGVKNVGAVIPGSTCVANPNHDTFEDDETPLVFESLPLDLLGADRPLAVFAPITVHRIAISLC